jgi:hypothetical protein
MNRSGCRYARQPPGGLPCTESPAGVAQSAEQPSCKRATEGHLSCGLIERLAGFGTYSARGTPSRGGLWECCDRSEAPPARRFSGGFEDFVEVPFEEVAVRPVGSVIGQVDDLPGPGVELIAVLEVLAQPSAHAQTN